jgi:membrane associated rhomboid family serine protease
VAFAGPGDSAGLIQIQVVMGIYDRGYYSDDEWKGSPSGSGAGPGLISSVVKALIVINVAIFLFDMFSGKVSEDSSELRLSHFLSLKYGSESQSGPLESPFAVWQLLTYGFAHASITSSSSIFHVLFNCLILFSLGRPVEERYGSAEFLRYYLVAVVFSGVVWLGVAALAGRPASVVGASGAVSAVVILFVLNYPRQTLLLMGIIPAPAWVLGILCILMDISLAASRSSTIAAEAHLAGAGFAAAYFFGKWNLGWMKLSGAGKWWRRKPRLRLHSPEDNEDLARQADQILEKVHKSGQDSLTSRERKILEEYSRKVRDSRN